MLRVGRHRGRWTCWLLLALGPLNSWGSPAAHRTLAGVVTDYVAPAVTAGYLVLATVGFAIWIWFAVAAARCGPWGMRRGPGPSVRQA